MPILIEWTYKDGSKEIEKLPAEWWRLNGNEFKKSFIKDKEVASVEIDPNQDLAEAEVSDNVFSGKQTEGKFDEMKKKIRIKIFLKHSRDKTMVLFYFEREVSVGSL